MRVTGHQYESSLRSYDKDNSVQQKRRISEILAKSSSDLSTSTSTSNFPKSVSATTTSQNDVLVSDPEIPETNFQTLSLPLSTHSTPLPLVFSTTRNTTTSSEISVDVSSFREQFMISNNTNCTFNFNFK